MPLVLGHLSIFLVNFLSLFFFLSPFGFLFLLVVAMFLLLRSGERKPQVGVHDEDGVDDEEDDDGGGGGDEDEDGDEEEDDDDEDGD